MKSLRILLLAAVTAGGAACSDTSGPTPQPVSENRLEIFAGAGQGATVTRPLPYPLVVIALDGDRKPLAGAAVSWHASGSGGTLAVAAAQTDAAGKAQATWTLGTRAGTDTVVATLAGGPSVTFLVTALPGPVARLGIAPKIIQLNAAGDIGSFAIQGLDAFDNVITNPPVTWTSYDTLVSTVNGGSVRATGPGVVQIRVEAGDVWNNGFVIVGNGAAYLDMDPTRFSGLPGDTITLTALGRALNGYIKDVSVEWSSTGSAPVAIEPTGPRTARVRFLGTGTARVRAVATGNSRGALGDVELRAVSAVPPLRLVTARVGYACSLDDGGRPSCWGGNLNDFLLTGITDLCSYSFHCTLTPTPVHIGLTFKTLAAGFGQTCGLLADGTAYCWGDPLLGSLGNGSQGSSIPVTAPVPVSGGHHFRTISTGVGHTCAIDLEDVAWCWGQNDYGEIGVGTGLAGLIEPVPVRVVTELRFRQLSAGDTHTCGIATTGDTWCWGQGNKLGQGFIADAKLPVKVVGGVALDSVWASWDQACGLTAAGAAYCWGINLGGVASSESLWLTPQRIAPGLAFVQLALRRDGGCGLTAAGEAYCWGQASDGQLGNGTSSSSVQVAPVRVSGPQRFRSLAAGGANTCGIATDGRLYCWGGSWANGRGGTHVALEPQVASFPMDYLVSAVRSEAPGLLRR